jgi:hypothetical protein
MTTLTQEQQQAAVELLRELAVAKTQYKPKNISSDMALFAACFLYVASEKAAALLAAIESEATE